MSRKTFRTALIALGVLLFLTGCSPFVDRDQTALVPEAAVLLEPGHPVGQTFVARHGGLSGVEFWLEPQPGSQGVLRLHLRSDPQSTPDLAVAALPLAQVTSPGFYRFGFPPDNRSHGVYYYAFLELDGEGAVRVGAASGEAYLDGAAYRDHQPLDAQLAFRTIYDPVGMALEVGQAALEGMGLLTVAALLYLVPGYALLAWLWRGEPLPWPARMGLAAGLSLALYPLLLLWTDVVGLHLGPLYAWLPVAGGLIALIWRYRRWRPWQGWEALRQWARSEDLWPDLAFIIILALVFGVRLLVVRTLDAPMWGDSYQHTMMAQLLVDNGGLFDSWEPYAPYHSLTVQFGFPAAVAVFSWVTGWESPKATLIVGQILNGLAVLTLYPLVLRIARGNRWAGVGATLVAGMFSPVPAFYVNWGRYAQLAGQVVLPVSLWLLWEILKADSPTSGGRFRFGMLGLAGFTVAGMALSYYRMPFYYGAFILALLIVKGLSTWHLRARQGLHMMASLVAVAFTALALVLPWGMRLRGGNLASAVEMGMATRPLAERVLADYQVWRELPNYIPIPLLAGAAAGFVWSMLRKQRTVILVVLWTIVLVSLKMGSLIRIPGANMLQNFAVIIAMYIPVGLLTGWLIGEIARLIGKERRVVGPLLCSLSLIGVGVAGFPNQQRIVQPSTFALVNRPDIRAMAWIRQNTPADARFLVEGFRIYEGRSVVGADAGWWIPLLAGRMNTMPPQYALLNETPADPGYSQRVVDLVAELEQHSPGSPEGLQRLCEEGITHVYVGQGQGNIGAGAVQLFSPDDLAVSPALRLVYREDRVWIFALNPSACQETRR